MHIYYVCIRPTWCNELNQKIFFKWKGKHIDYMDILVRLRSWPRGGGAN